VLPVHAAAELFPRMSRDELLALGADIKANGLRSPVTIFHADVDRAELLDGISRLDAMEMAGIAIVKDGAIDRDMAECTDVDRNTDPHAYVISVNIHRRRLTAEQRSDLIAKVIEANPEKSDRQIAEMVERDHKTVGKVRAVMEDVGRIPHVATRTDSKGRKQPARKATKRKPTKTVTTNVEALTTTEAAGGPPEPKAAKTVSPKDTALIAFTERVLNLVQRIAKHEAVRFAGTVVKTDDLARLGKFFTELARLKGAEVSS
jgi:hypothetical protein